MLNDKPLIRGALYIITAELFVVLVSGIVKTAHESLPLEMIVFFRNLFGLVALSPLLLSKDLSNLRTSIPWWHILRAVTGLSGMYCFFYMVGELKLANATALIMAAPIIIPFVAYLILGENINKLILMALVIAFLGVAAILRPEINTGWVVLIAVVASVSIAFAQVSIRKLSFTEPASRIVFYFTAMALIISAIPLLWAWQTPTTIWQWCLLITLGPASTVTQLCLARGYALAPASQLGIFTYSSVLFGATAGWLIWEEIWDLLSIFGAALIVCAGGFVLKFHSDSRSVISCSRKA